MKSAISLMLVTCLVASTVPLTAQEKAETLRQSDLREPASQRAAGSLASAITREAIQLASPGAPTSSGLADTERLGGTRTRPSLDIETFQQGGQATESRWSRVRTLAPGTEIIVTVKGSAPVQRYFVATGESDLTVLNLTDSTFPAAVKERLLDATSRHPEYFPAARQGGTFVLSKKGLLQTNARLGPDGVFVADQKVADLGQVVESIARVDVAEIKAWRRQRAPSRMVGYGFAGYFVGGIIGGSVDRSLTGCDTCLSGLMLSAIAGAIGGVTLADRVFAHKAEDVIYRAQ